MKTGADISGELSIKLVEARYRGCSQAGAHSLGWAWSAQHRYPLETRCHRMVLAHLAWRELGVTSSSQHLLFLLKVRINHKDNNISCS